MNSLFSGLPTTIFEAMSQLARETGAINLGQGFPDDPGPPDIRQKAADAVLNGYNQYPPMMGLPELREAVARHYAHWHGVAFDPATEVMITSGATEAIAGALFALIEPGDEVVLFQPMYDAYLPLVKRAGGVPKLVRLEPPHWRFDEEMLDRAFSPKTRLVVLNNPLNPTATVFGRGDLELLAHYCKKFDAVAVCDEVWEHVVFDGIHVPLAALPGMRERTVKIGSAGKIFSLTGWKVGFVCAAPHLMKALSRAHQFLTFTTPPNLQAAVAYGLGKDDAFFEDMRRSLARSRDRLTAGLREIGLPPLESQGTYFLNLDIAPLRLNMDDETFCRNLVQERGVALIPVSAFYAENPVTNVVRICFSKEDRTIDTALERLAGLAR